MDDGAIMPDFEYPYSYKKFIYYQSKDMNNYSEELFLKDIINPKKSYAKTLEKALFASTGGKRYRRDRCDGFECLECLKTCNYLKNSNVVNTYVFTQFFYLTICAEGCKQVIDCFEINYCLPVMYENPSYFVYCANTCPIFDIIPNIFLQ